jgi:hypothetical protein
MSESLDTTSHIIGLFVLSLSQVAQKTVIILESFFKLFKVIKIFSRASAV